MHRLNWIIIIFSEKYQWIMLNLLGLALFYCKNLLSFREDNVMAITEAKLIRIIGEEMIL